MTATIFEAKTNLSELIQRAQAGESIVITSGREKTPVAKLEPIHAQKVQRLGLLEHLNIDIPDSALFDPMSEEDLRLWEGGDDSEA